MRLLIVEHDEVLAERELAVAAKLGLDAIRVGDGLSAISELCALGHERHTTPMLLDQVLPDGDASGLIEAVRAQGMEMPPFIVTTEAGDERVAVSMMKRGARDYLVKDSSFIQTLPQALVRLIRELESEMSIDETKSALVKVERRLRMIVENSNDIIFLYDPLSRRFTYMSPSIAALWGAGELEAMSRRLKDYIRPKEYESLKRDLASRLAAFRAGDLSRATTLYRSTIDRPTGGPIRLEVLTTLFVNDDGAPEMLGVGRDVEERARMEESLTRSIREKEVLLKEVHHRVKNNLQIITSLINLQMDSVKNKKAAQALVDSQNRIRSMAMIHEQLYRSPNLNEIVFGDYIRSIVPILIEGFASPVSLEFELSSGSLPLDTAIPCGLILNELVTNAAKHAFPHAREPALLIRFGMSKRGAEYAFLVADNGPGFDYDRENGSTLGLTLVESLVGQIGGRLEIDGTNGARFSITFPAGPPESRSP